jgi:putative acetyltransferase
VTLAAGTARDAGLALRGVDLADAQPLWALRTRAIRELCAGYYPAADIAAWAATAMPPRFGEVLVLQRAVVVDEGERAVGFGFLDRDDGEVAAVYVSPEVARRGVGRLILARLEADARTAGLATLRLASSLNAVRFYRAAGYGDERPDTFRHPGGFDLPCVRMTKRLAR